MLELNSLQYVQGNIVHQQDGAGKLSKGIQAFVVDAAVDGVVRIYLTYVTWQEV